MPLFEEVVPVGRVIIGFFLILGLGFFYGWVFRWVWYGDMDKEDRLEFLREKIDHGLS